MVGVHDAVVCRQSLAGVRIINNKGWPGWDTHRGGVSTRWRRALRLSERERHIVKLLLIRHGQSQSNLAWIEGRKFSGGGDSALTPLGHDQAHALARAFEQGKLPRPDRLLSSLMVRAVQTVAPVSEALGMPVSGVLDVHEVGGVSRGDDGSPEGSAPVGSQSYPGLGRFELSNWCPGIKLPPTVTEQGWYFRPVESREQGWRRAQQVASRLQEQYGPDELIALVTHGLFINFLLGVLAGWQPDLAAPTLDTWYQINNAGTLLLMSPGPYGERLWIEWINRVDHMAPDQLTM